MPSGALPSALLGRQSSVGYIVRQDYKHDYAPGRLSKSRRAIESFYRL